MEINGRFSSLSTKLFYSLPTLFAKLGFSATIKSIQSRTTQLPRKKLSKIQNQLSDFGAMIKNMTDERITNLTKH